MQDHPTARELIESVSQFLNGEIVPTLSDPRLKFRALVAANVLNIVAREMEMGDLQLSAEYERLAALLPSPEISLLDFGRGVMRQDADGARQSVVLTHQRGEDVQRMTRELSQKIRAGEVDEGEFHDAVFAHVEQTIIEKLQVANPKYLERVLNEP
jgi:hypothetical protein